MSKTDIDFKIIDSNELDVQVREAFNDIQHSHTIIAGLQTLDPTKYTFLDSLIEFHEIRIKNCTDAIKKYFIEQKKKKKNDDKCG